MKKSIYEISVRHLELAEILEQDEVTPELELELAINEADLDTKIVAYSYIIKDYKARKAQIKEQKSRMDGLEKTTDKVIEKLEQRIKAAMLIFGKEKIETPLVTVSFINSDSVEITNEAQLDAKFVVTKTTTAPDKVAIKAAIKAGEFVEGATINYKKNIQIK